MSLYLIKARNDDRRGFLDCYVRMNIDSAWGWTSTYFDKYIFLKRDGFGRDPEFIIVIYLLFLPEKMELFILADGSMGICYKKFKKKISFLKKTICNH